MIRKLLDDKGVNIIYEGPLMYRVLLICDMTVMAWQFKSVNKKNFKKNYNHAYIKDRCALEGDTLTSQQWSFSAIDINRITPFWPLYWWEILQFLERIVKKFWMEPNIQQEYH